MVKVEHGNPLAALADGRVLLLAITYVGFPLAAQGDSIQTLARPRKRGF